MGMSERVAIVGCGLIGQKRASSLGEARLVVCCDSILERAEALSLLHSGAETSAHWGAAVTRPDVDIVVVATTHDLLAPVARAAAEAGKHVLVEKPAGRRPAELDPVIAAAEAAGVIVRVGFNHRYHRALRKARELVDSGAMGRLMFLRGRYGHGGRPGYEKEWRADPHIAGGGEVIDQGVHLIDLAHWFLGDFTEVKSFIGTFFWGIRVEDNGFLLLRTESGQVAFLHASWTEWKNTFSLEIYGERGKLEIIGLGGSYGTERLAYYEMQPEMGPPPTTVWEYPMADDSWQVEFNDFLTDTRAGRSSGSGLRDARAALSIVERVYQENSS